MGGILSTEVHAELGMPPQNANGSDRRSRPQHAGTLFRGAVRAPLIWLIVHILACQGERYRFREHPLSVDERCSLCAVVRETCGIVLSLRHHDVLIVSHARYATTLAPNLDARVCRVWYPLM